MTEQNEILVPNSPGLWWYRQNDPVVSEKRDLVAEIVYLEDGKIWVSDLEASYEAFIDLDHFSKYVRWIGPILSHEQVQELRAEIGQLRKKLTSDSEQSP